MVWLAMESWSSDVDGDTVLACYDTPRGLRAVQANRKDGKWLCDIGEIQPKCWMPMPEPPDARSRRSAELLGIIQTRDE